MTAWTLIAVLMLISDTCATHLCFCLCSPEVDNYVTDPSLLFFSCGCRHILNTIPGKLQIRTYVCEQYRMVCRYSCSDFLQNNQGKEKDKITGLLTSI